jgi:hypothetical protein
MVLIIILLSNLSSMNAKPNNINYTHSKTINVYLDSFWRFDNVIKSEIKFVNYCRDRMQANLYIKLSHQRTGTGGTEYTMTFIGKKEYEGLNDTLKYTSSVIDSRKTTEEGIIRNLKLGLLPYLKKTPLFKFITISYTGKEEEIQEIDDKWNHWVFRISTGGKIEKEETKDIYNLDLLLSASRVTEELKINSFFNGNYNLKNYITDDEEYTSIRKSGFFRTELVKSLGEHFSAGIVGLVNSESYNNIRLSYSLAPAFEYNLYPYSEYTSRQFTFLYRIGFENTSYTEETIFEKTKEFLYYQAIDIHYDIEREWGHMDFYIEGRNYLHDFKKNRITGGLRFSVNLFEGFSLSGAARISAIHDQLSLSSEGATKEEILLEQKSLATQYRISSRIGISYTFGSIYENILNPRF